MHTTDLILINQKDGPFIKDNLGFSRTKERNSFAKYNGSYAQDVMGWSDNDIEDILDGDSDAYWNID